jgi:hypothetical protein
VAECLGAHALEEHGGERRRKHEPSRRRMGMWKRENSGCKVAVAQRKARATGAKATGARR